MVEINHNKYLDLAIRQAEIALTKNEVPVGCVIVRNNEVLVMGHNLTNINSNPLSHAEHECLLKCCDLTDLTVYITIEPCVFCYGILQRVKAKIYYGYENEIFGTKKLLNIQTGVLIKNEKCIELLREFYHGENKLKPQ